MKSEYASRDAAVPDAVEAGSAEHARQQAEAWLHAFEFALRSGDAARIGRLFHADCHWRDVLAFTRHYSSAQGRDAVGAGLAREQGRVDAHAFHVPQDRRAPCTLTRLGVESVEAIFAFETSLGTGAGLLRLSRSADDGEMRAWFLSTTPESLRGHEERVGANRPSGAAYSRNFGGDNWADMRRRAVAYEDREPAVLVIGGAQSALLIKGELGLLQYDRIERFVAEGARLKDGTTVPADLIVLATGYYPQEELVRRTLGDAMAERIGPVWGIGADGELRNMYKRTPQPGVWFIAGGLPQCRINSKYLALQIKAMELGILQPLRSCGDGA